MPSINLRPWREERRAERQKQFATMWVGSIIIAAGLVFLWQGQVDSQIDYQNSRNNYIKSSMKELDKKMVEIKELKEKKEQLESRMEVIQSLQGTRPIVVRVFDELVVQLPEGLYFNNLKRTKNNLQLQGFAESNTRISSLMRNFESSLWFDAPNLSDVKAVKGRDDLNTFVMSVTQVLPELRDDGQGGVK